MNTDDDKGSVTAAPDTTEKGAPSHTENTPPDTPDKTALKDKSLGFVILFFVLGFAASLVVGWVVFPKLLYSQKRQPIDFNHALHVELVDDGCAGCHFFRPDGSFSGVPRLAQCVACHESPQGESESEARFVEEYVAKGREVPWLVYARQPDCVFFSHAAHINLAKMDCATCHGPVGKSEHLKIYEENRITGYSRDIWGKNIAGFKKNSWDRMKMDDCADCHAAQANSAQITDVEPSLRRLFTNVVNIVFPNSTKTGKVSSVQTGKEACFVCHK